MKVTTDNARADSSGRHNDRNFDISKASHIDAERSINNRYYTWNHDYENTFADIEMNFYEENFQEGLNAQNQRNIENRNGHRNKTMKQYIRNINTRPEDRLLQIGNYFEHVTGDELWACALEYAQRFDEIYGDNCKILDMALHMDEATPHVHIRRVWIGTDDYGHKCVSQNKALEEMGFERPNLNKPVSPANNAKISFTELDRNLFIDICREREIDIEILPEPQGKQREEEIPIELFKEKHPIKAQLDKLKEEVKEQETFLIKADSFIEQFRMMMLNLLKRDDEYKKKLEELKEAERNEKIKGIQEIYEKAIAPISKDTNLSFEAMTAKVNESITSRQMMRFIEKKGLASEYNQYIKDKKEKYKETQKDKVQ